MAGWRTKEGGPALRASMFISATAVGFVVGALVAIGVGPLSVRCCGVWSEVVRVRLRVVDLWGSDEVAQAVEEERGPAPSHVVAPLAVEQPLKHAKRLREAHAVFFLRGVIFEWQKSSPTSSSTIIEDIKGELGRSVELAEIFILGPDHQPDRWRRRAASQEGRRVAAIKEGPSLQARPSPGI